MAKKRIAVTGAAGTVGSALVRRLSRVDGVDVVAICRNKVSAGIIDYLNPNCTIRTGSITEKDKARNLLDDCDVVINCALAAGGGNPKNAYRSNKQIIDGILAARNLKLFIHFSSIAVYGDFIDESTRSEGTVAVPRPDNEYGRAKLIVEQYAESACRSQKIEYRILRLGHVIGAGTDRSREIIELSRSPWFRLPFDGQLPSNTIHAERLASAVSLLLDSSTSSGIYNAAEKERTWRAVFDWHTNCLSLPRVEAMDPSECREMVSLYSERSVVRDVQRWMRSLPLNNLIRSPALFDLSLRILKRMPDALTTYIGDISRRSGAARQISSLSHGQHRPVSPVYFSQAMPGRFMDFPSEAPSSSASEEGTCTELKTWYERFSRPKILLDS